jgi:sigma-E factor negative regulatory protein RseC
MIEQQGRVVSVAHGRVSVRLGGSSACATCDAGKGCGAGVFGRLLRRKPIVLDFADELHSRVGQGVVVGLPESLLLRLVLRFYLLPLLAGLAGAALGHYLAVRIGATGAMIDGVAATGAILAGLGALIGARLRVGEFLPENAVHLLRHVDQGLTERAGSATLTERHERDLNTR